MNDAAYLQNLRSEYLANRRVTCAHKGWSAEWFDRQVRENIRANPDPADWVAGARALFNISVPCRRCNTTRCPDGCCCGC